MEKKLLIFISIILLNSAPSYADNESELPALPTSFEVQEEIKSDSDSSKSFWQKIKEYFGFGEEKKIVDKQPDTPPAVRKTENIEQTTQSESMKEGQGIATQANYDNSSDSSIPPIGSTDEGPMNVKIPESQNEVDVPDQIKLPDSFGEDVIKNPDSATSPNEPIQDVTNLGVDPSKDNNTTATSKISDHAAINETAKETIPKTAELSIPQLPEADEGKEITLKNDITKEAVEPKIEEVPALQEQPVVKLELPTDKPVAESTAISPDITVPEYANAAQQPNEDTDPISKYKKSFEAKTSTPVVLPKLSESELSLENKSKQVDLKASDLEAFDTKQLKFVNNEAQVLILPNDDIVLGVLVDEAKLDQMDFRSYVDIFWDNYNRLKREPKRLEIERFIENYDELFDSNNSLYEEK